MISQENKQPSRVSRFLRQQFGSSDVEMVMFIVVLITIASVVYLVLGWIKSTKDERIENRAKAYREYNKNKNASPVDRGPANDQLVF